MNKVIVIDNWMASLLAALRKNTTIGEKQTIKKGLDRGYKTIKEGDSCFIISKEDYTFILVETKLFNSLFTNSRNIIKTAKKNALLFHCRKDKNYTRIKINGKQRCYYQFLLYFPVSKESSNCIYYSAINSH